MQTSTLTARREQRESERAWEEIMAANFTNQLKDIDIDVLGAPQSPRRMNSERPQAATFITELSKYRMLKAKRQNE